MMLLLNGRPKKFTNVTCMDKILRTELAIVITGVAIVFAAPAPYAVPLIFVWVVCSKLSSDLLLCRSCGNRLITDKLGGYRRVLFCLRTCAHCGYMNK